MLNLLPGLNRVDHSGNFGRLYETPDGKRYPSVTTFLSLFTKDSILEWRKRVGEEEANKVSSRAAKRGTKFHTVVEQYLKNDELPNLDFIEESYFNNSKKNLNRIDNIYLQETPLYSDSLRLAGTLDCMAEYDGELSIIDFKTSKSFKHKQDISNYFIQATCYSIMVEELFGMKAKKLVILFQSDEGESFVHIDDRKNWFDILIDMRKLYKEKTGC